MILCAFRFGMRASQVGGLRLSDIDMKDGAITIRRLKGSRTSVFALANVQGQPLLSVARVLKRLARRAQDAAGRERFRIRFTEGRKALLLGILPDVPGCRHRSRNAAGETSPALLQAQFGIRHGLSESEPYNRPERVRAYCSVVSTGIYAQPSREQVDHAVQATLLELF